jgi:hypothetical protein
MNEDNKDSTLIEVVYHCPTCETIVQGTVKRGTSFDDDQAFCPNDGTRLSALRTPLIDEDIGRCAVVCLTCSKSNLIFDLLEIVVDTDLTHLPIARTKLVQDFSRLTQAIINDGEATGDDALTRLGAALCAFDHLAAMEHRN